MGVPWKKVVMHSADPQSCTVLCLFRCSLPRDSRVVPVRAMPTVSKGQWVVPQAQALQM